MSVLRTLLLATVAVVSPVAVYAQTPPNPPVTPPTTPPSTQPATTPATQPPAGTEETDESAVETVTVTGERNAVRRSIDSISYSTADDLQAQTGTLADALRNIPSVDVDPSGNVSLRGDGNVTILVDGRPSALFSGPGRAQAVLQTPGSQFSRIEVMTNPSAAFRPDGAGGVINLITSPNYVRPGNTYSGSVRANVGGDGLYNLGVSGAYTFDRLTLTGDFGLRHDRQNATGSGVRERYDAGEDAFLQSRTTFDSDSPSDGTFVRLAAEYRPDDAWQFNGELRRQAFESDGDTLSTFEADDVDGNLISAYQRRGTGGFSGEFAGATARVIRTWGEEFDWTNELRYDANSFETDTRSERTYSVPVLPALFEVNGSSSDEREWAFTSAFRRPIGEDQKLRLGYDGEHTNLDLDTLVLRGPTENTVVVDPTFSNRFTAEQTIHAFYGTYERPLSEHLTAQFGLRLEYVTREINQITQGLREENDYFRVYPTFHFEYALSETETLRASYSRRVQRPDPQQLNPFVVYGDEQNYSSGNPGLLPQITDSYEISWNRRANQTFYQATFYYRDTSEAFTSLVTDLGGGVLLTRPENLGANRSYGVEFVANGRLHPTLRYNASINIYNQSIDVSNLGFGSTNSDGTTFSGRVSFNWQPTPNDFVQLGGFYRGDTILAQGRSDGRGMVNFGYRRKLNDRWSLQFTVRDLLDSFSGATYRETPTVRDSSENQFGGRTAFIGFTWTFGNSQNRQQQQPQFDFSGPQGGPGGQ